jgi:GNAT superfamily N-acetyltransferase
MNIPGQQSSLQVRLATPDEASPIALLLHQAFIGYESLYTAEAFAITTPTAGQIEERWQEGPVWTARQEGRLVGTVAAVPKGDALYIRSMAVLPNARGHGIGKLLLEQVESFARAGGFRRMFLSTTPFLHEAIRLYERFGFVRTSDGPHELAGTPLFTMEKALTSQDSSSLVS